MKTQILCTPTDQTVILLVDNLGNVTFKNPDNTAYTGDTSLLGKCCCNETPATLVDNGDGSFTYINEAGTSVTWTETNTTITNTVVGNKIADYTSEDGTATAINETITTISGNIYTNEAGTPVDIIQTVEATLDTNGDLIITVNGVDSTPLDIPTIPTWKKEILDIVADNTIPNLGFLPVADSVILVYDGYTLCENLHYTISGQSITFNPANLGKDILVGELVHVQYQTII